MNKYLDPEGLSYLWQKITDGVDEVTNLLPMSYYDHGFSQVGTLGFGTENYYAQSMHYVEGYWYAYIVPRSNNPDTTCYLNKYDGSSYELKLSVPIADTNYLGHGNSLTYYEPKRELIYLGRSRQYYVYYSIDSDNITGSYYLGSGTEGPSSFAISPDSSKYTFIPSGGRGVLRGDIKYDNGCTNRVLPIPSIGKGVIADSAIYSDYLYQAVHYSRESGFENPQAYVVAMSIDNGAVPFVLHLKGFENELEGVAFVGSTLYVCDALGNIFELDTLPADSLSETALAYQSVSFAPHGLSYVHSGSSGNFNCVPFAPVSAGTRLLLAYTPIQLNLGNMSFPVVPNRGLTGYYFAGTDSSGTQVGASLAFVDDTLRFNRLIYGSVNTAFATTLSMSDYLSAYEAFLDSLPSSGSTRSFEISGAGISWNTKFSANAIKL